MLKWMVSYQTCHRISKHNFISQYWQYNRIFHYSVTLFHSCVCFVSRFYCRCRAPIASLDCMEEFSGTGGQLDFGIMTFFCSLFLLENQTRTKKKWDAVKLMFIGYFSEQQLLSGQLFNDHFRIVFTMWKITTTFYMLQQKP